MRGLYILENAFIKGTSEIYNIDNLNQGVARVMSKGI